MTQIIQIKQWFGVVKSMLAILIVALLIAGGVHPVWGIVLFIFRRAAFRICLLFGLLYWLTHGLV